MARTRPDKKRLVIPLVTNSSGGLTNGVRKSTTCDELILETERGGSGYLREKSL